MKEVAHWMFAWTDQNNKKSKKSIPIRKQYIAKQTATFNNKKREMVEIV